VFGGWVASCDDRILLVTEDDEQVDEAVLALARIGLDGVEAALSGGFASWRDAGRPLAHAAVLAPRDLHEQLDAWPVVDVREPDEYAQGHIPGAHRAYVGHLPDALSDAELDRDEPLVVTCGVGHRASVAVGLLQRAGYRRVHNLLGGMSAWKTLELPLEQGDP
jgi:hydroxyacylglutathione hydrolase